MSLLMQVLTNKIFLSGLIAGLIAQFFKMVILSIKTKKFSLWYYFELAGMPSSHTATAVALTTAVYYTEGVSTLFIVGIAVTYYIIDEVISVERSIGKQAHIINEIVKIFSKKLRFKAIRERWGHTISEVIAGFILGIIVAAAVFTYL